MVSFLQGLSNAFRALDCGILSGADYVFGSANRLAGVVDPTTSNVINALRRLRGCDPQDDPIPPPPPFAGGQCDGELYTGSWSARIGSEEFTRTVNFTAWGPIGGVQSVFQNGTFATGLVSRGATQSSDGVRNCSTSPGQIGPTVFSTCIFRPGGFGV